MIELPKRKIMFIGDAPPDGDPKYYAWIDTVYRQVKVYEGGQWISKADFADPMPEGEDAEIKTEGGVLVFKNGILVKHG
jgi:hypothetical protein